MYEEKFFVEGREDFIPPVNDSPYKRIIAIGDVHGQIWRLMSLWKKLYVTDEDLIIFLGDYIVGHKGDNYRTLLWLADISRQENVIALMGNMDYGLVEFLEDKLVTDIPREILHFLRGLRFSHCIEVGGRKYFFCHGGINPDKPLEAQRKSTLMGEEGIKKFYCEYAGDDVIVVGHRGSKKIAEKIPRVADCVRADFDAYKPFKIPCANILMLDTRAKESEGRLSAVDIISGEYWQGDDVTSAIIFVCAWNTCRSAMAEYIMRHLLDEAGLTDKVYVDSAGCLTEGGEPLGKRTRLTLEANKIPVGSHISKLFTEQDYRRFDLIISLDEDILQFMKRKFDGDPKNKIRLLKDFDGNEIRVADPGHSGEHAEAYKKILRGCEALVKEIENAID